MKNRLVTKFLTDENFWPTKLVSDEISTDKVLRGLIFFRETNTKTFISQIFIAAWIKFITFDYISIDSSLPKTYIIR